MAGRRAVSRARVLVQRLFDRADIRLDGDRPHDIRVLDDRFYRRVLLDGSLGLGEAYVDGWWEAVQIDAVMCRFAQANLHRLSLKDWRLLLAIARVQAGGIGTKARAFEVGKRHYDLGNELFEIMLDKRMIYSCAYWANATSLDGAQADKLDLVCRKLGLKPGMRILEIGCGWGGWAKYAAETYGVEVVGLSVSKEQIAFAREACAGLPVEFRLQDYRDVKERFDRIVSIGMFEHVGRRYYRTFMRVVDRCLRDDGLFLLHSIVGNEPLGAAQIPWITKYIFPNGEIPSLAQITVAAQNVFVVEAMHHFADDYDRTLAAWYTNFTTNRHVLGNSYDERFVRMWTYYLLMARGFFEARAVHVWQVVFSKRNRSAAIRSTSQAVLDAQAADVR